MEPLSVLLQAYPFQDVSAADVEPILGSFSLRSYRRGQTIWDVGDPADHLWFILSGAVHGVYSSPDGEEIVSMLYGAGESFGEVGLFLPDGRRQARCVATNDATMMTLARQPLLAFLERHPPALRRMLKMLSVMAFRQGVAFREHALRDVRSRVAWRLLDLAQRHGETAAGGTRITPRLSQTILAGMIGASRANVSRAISSFAATGAIRVEGGHIVVTNVQRLRAVLGTDAGMLLGPAHGTGRAVR